MKPKKNAFDIQTAWNMRVEELIVKECPEQRGKIVWANLKHLYCAGDGTQEAAAKVIKILKGAA
jgi:hypothetical protein